MKKRYFKMYKGYTGTIEYNAETREFYGELANTIEKVKYYAKSLMKLEEAFHNAVNNYILYRTEIKNNN